MTSYKIVILDGTLGEVEANMNTLAAEGYRLRDVVQAATAAAPSTTFKPLAIMERVEDPRG